jgi:hypothetical protein
LTYTGGNVTQTLCEGDAITDIVFTPSAGATIVVGENLPDGLTIFPNAGAGTFTLSGTPTAAISSQITYNFNVTTQGNGCTTDPIAISIVVNPDDDISLTSNNNELQTVCEGEAIENITYILEGGANGASVSGLPNGVNFSVNSGVQYRGPLSII